MVYRWTTGDDPVFRSFYDITEAYYIMIAGGADKRREYVPYNASEDIPHALLAFAGGVPAGCAGLKQHGEGTAELKRLWVEPAFRRQGIASALMDRAEERARSMGCTRLILQTRPAMRGAVALYLSRGYLPIPNFPPYDHLEGAVCYAKEL